MDKRVKKIYKKNLKNQLKLRSEKNKDCFSMNEPGQDDNVFSFVNLLELDRDDWAFQKEHQTMLFADEYTDQLYIPGRWFRAVEYVFSPKKPRLVYGQLEALESWLATTVSDELTKIIDKKIPNLIARKYSEPMFEKIEGSEFMRWNMGDIRANGREEELELYKRKARDLYPLLRYKARLVAKAYEGSVFRKYLKDGSIDDLELFIIGGQTAAENIRFETFFDDVYDLVQPYGVIKKVKNHFIREFKELLLSTADIGEIYTIYDQLELLD